MQTRTVIAAGALALLFAATVSTIGAGAQAPGAGRAGFFNSVCDFTHRAADDPIVFPGRPGASHSHDFFGNPSTGAGSTLESLSAVGGRCRQAGDRAGYWIPSLRQRGRVVPPLRANVYYRTAGRDPAAIQPFPRGLRVVAGDARASGPQGVRAVRWSCAGAEGMQSATPPLCPPGTRLKLSVLFPDCWNGRDLDSPDHRSHMADSVRAGRGMRACPHSHPRAVPKLVLNVPFATRGGRGLDLASGSVSTAHADFFNAWDEAELARLVRECLTADVHCAPPRGARA